jgi:hypothetical protein
MIDLEERELWRLEYLKAGHEFAPATEQPAKILAWAFSMSMIAEQFCDNDDYEEAEIYA